MESGRKPLIVSGAAPVFIFLFFFNCFLLPQGITFSLLLTPVWLYLLHQGGRLHLLKYVLSVMAVYAVIHLMNGADPQYYVISSILLFLCVVFCLAATPYLRASRFDYDRLFQRIVVLNFVFTLLSIPMLFIGPLKDLVWYSMSMSDNIKVIPRLKLFCYEASHYSYLIAPVVIYYATKAMFGDRPKPWAYLAMLGLSLAMSLSFGVIACLLFTAGIVVLVYFNRIFDTGHRRLMLFAGVAMLLVAAFVLYRFFPDNIIAMRIRNMLTGHDTSARGRTYESFILAQRIVSQKSLLWGIGPGQLKVLGRTIIVQYYYYSRIPEPIRIPNACAETIVCFGYVGFALRIAVQLALFFTTKVFRSPYRLWLFLFLFLFQFMGSYITNVTEYLFWIFVFLPASSFFERKRAGKDIL